MTSLVASSSRILYGHAITRSATVFCGDGVARNAMRLAAPLRLASRRPPPSSLRAFYSSPFSGRRPKFSHRLGEALRKSKVQWYQIPVGLGIAFLGLVQFYKVSARERERSKHEEEHDLDGSRKVNRRPRVRPDGPWCVNPCVAASLGDCWS